MLNQKKLFLQCLLLMTGMSACEKSLYKYNEADILNDKSVPKIINVIDHENLNIYQNKSEIPRMILKTLKSGSEGFTIANPGQPWQNSDVITRRLPERQLIFIAKNSHYFIMVYNHGGFGKHKHIIFAESDLHKLVDFWAGSFLKKDIRNLDDVKSVLGTGGQSFHNNVIEY